VLAPGGHRAAPALRGEPPRHRPAREPLLHQHDGRALGRAALRRRELVRPRRQQRARGARGRAAAPGRRPRAGRPAFGYHLGPDAWVARCLPARPGRAPGHLPRRRGGRRGSHPRPPRRALPLPAAALVLGPRRADRAARGAARRRARCVGRGRGGRRRSGAGRAHGRAARAPTPSDARIARAHARGRAGGGGGRPGPRGARGRGALARPRGARRRGALTRPHATRPDRAHAVAVAGPRGRRRLTPAGASRSTTEQDHS
jgi:hypothetical protein